MARRKRPKQAPKTAPADVGCGIVLCKWRDIVEVDGVVRVERAIEERERSQHGMLRIPDMPVQSCHGIDD
jgi:hypothetical protein